MGITYFFHMLIIQNYPIKLLNSFATLQKTNN